MCFIFEEKDIRGYAGTQKWLEDLEKIVGKKLKLNVYSHGVPFHTVMCQVYDLDERGIENSLIVSFSFTSMPNCQQTLISYGVIVHYGLEGRGIGSVTHKFKLDFLRALKTVYGQPWFDNVICTVNDENEAELKILRKNGWVELLPATRKYGSSLWGKQLQNEGEQA